jgi:hypothetical protein
MGRWNKNIAYSYKTSTVLKNTANGNIIIKNRLAKKKLDIN